MGKAILIVDGSLSIRRMAVFILKTASQYEIHEAKDGQEGLAMAQAKHYDLVIAEQNLNRLDGVDLIRRLRGQPQYQNAPLLILASEWGNAMKSRIRAAGATACLAMPFDPQKLLDAVKTAIR